MTGELLLVARVDGRLVALPAAEVASVSELEKITPVPRAPDWIEGVGAQRSRALTVVNCRRAIGLATETEATGSDETRYIVVRCDGHLYALRVDAILDVTMAQSDQQALPKGLTALWRDIARGTIETSFGPALVIDLPALLAGPERAAA